MSNPFRKMRGINDRQLNGALTNQQYALQYHARVLNHHGRVILLIVAYIVVDVLCHAFINLW
jgi:hypothetical protein